MSRVFIHKTDEKVLRIMTSIFRYSISDHDSRPRKQPGVMTLFILLIDKEIAIFSLSDSQ